METKKQIDFLKFLVGRYCGGAGEVLLVESVADWCSKNGIKEADPEKPVRVVREDSACRAVVRDYIPPAVMEDRIKALSVRHALLNLSFDPADRLDSDKKKIAYLVLREYAVGLPEHKEDELLADEWALTEMEKLDLFKE
ncbi:MAG: hypothetical protein Kow0025_06000 [Thermodesulfovibrionales bacterium]